MKVVIGIILMISSTLMMMKYLSFLKKEANEDGAWTVGIKELLRGGSFFIIMLFMIGLLLVITGFK